MNPAATDVPMALPGLVEQLATALVASRLHALGHPGLEKPSTAVIGHLDLLRQETGESQFTLTVAGDQLVLQGRWPAPASLSVSRLVEVLQRWGAGGLQFEVGVDSRELGTLLGMLARFKDGVDLTMLADSAARAGCRRIGVVAPSAVPRRAAHAGGDGTFAAILDEVSAAFTGVAAGSAIDVGTMTQCVGALLGAIDQAAKVDEPDLDLSRQEHDDPLAVHHSVRVAGLAMIAMRSLTTSAELVERVGLAALLHDVGRMLLPFEVLQANPDLDDATEQALLEHPTLGAEFLLAHPDVDPLAVAVAFGHHRVHRGKGGYPPTIHEHQTSRVTELVRIADKFEALTAVRPHRDAFTPTRALRMLLTDREILDPGLLRAFVQANGIYPLGAVVQLDNGQVARIVRQSTDLSKPIVRALTSAAGAPSGGLVDLSRQRPSQTQVTIHGPAPRR